MLSPDKPGGMKTHYRCGTAELSRGAKLYFSAPNAGDLVANHAFDSAVATLFRDEP